MSEEIKNDIENEDVETKTELEIETSSEAKKLRAMGVFETCPTAAQAIGYKELFPYLDGVATLEAAADVLKMATRRYAKRQVTWFAAKPYVTWITADEGGETKDFEEIVNNAEKLFSQRGFCGII